MSSSRKWWTRKTLVADLKCTNKMLSMKASKAQLSNQAWKKAVKSVTVLVRNGKKPTLNPLNSLSSAASLEIEEKLFSTNLLGLERINSLIKFPLMCLLIWTKPWEIRKTLNLLLMLKQILTKKVKNIQKTLKLPLSLCLNLISLAMLKPEVMLNTTSKRAALTPTNLMQLALPVSFQTQTSLPHQV